MRSQMFLALFLFIILSTFFPAMKKKIIRGAIALENSLLLTRPAEL